MDSDSTVKLIVRISEKLETIDNRLNTMNETLVRNTVSLEEHIRRTNLLEAAHSELDKKYAPTKERMDKLTFVGALMAGALAMGGAVAGISAAIHRLLGQ